MKWLIGLLAAVFCFFVVTIRTGHRWGDDYALYILEAKNIATGTAYPTIGLIADPYYPSYSPRMTPPGFPLLLAPLYKVFGLNLEAFKAEEVVFFVGALAAACLFFQSWLPPAWVLLFAAIMGFNPFFWNFKDDVLSDIPFLFFLWLEFLLLERRMPAVLCGFVAYLAIATRGAGIVLLPAILLCELWRRRRISRYSAVVVLTSLACLLVQRLVLGGDPVAAYGDVFRPSLAATLSNLTYYRNALPLYWGVHSFWAPLLVSVVLLAAALAGRREQEPVLPLVFACFYVPVLVFWPYPSARYLMPLFPLFLFYALRGMARLGKVATVIACVLVLAGYVSYYRGASYSNIPMATGRETFVAMCSYIKSNTLPGDRFVFYRARSLALFAERPTSPYHQPDHPDDLWRYFHEQSIRYVVVSNLFEKDRNVLVPLVDDHKAELTLTYENPEFKVYKIP
jgi:hypothetical protein